jgi:hypothetical protein
MQLITAHLNTPQYSIPSFTEYRDQMADLLAAFDADEIDQHAWSEHRAVEILDSLAQCNDLAELDAVCASVVDDVFLLTQPDRHAIDAEAMRLRWRFQRADNAKTYQRPKAA